MENRIEFIVQDFDSAGHPFILKLKDVYYKSGDSILGDPHSPVLREYIDSKKIIPKVTKKVVEVTPPPSASVIDPDPATKIVDPGDEFNVTAESFPAGKSKK